MPINESDPLGIGKGVDVSDPLGIAGPIQKMKPTEPSIGPWSPTIGQRLEMASPSLFGGEIQPATGMPEGLVPRGLNAVQSLMTHAPFAQQTEPDPTQPNLIPGTPPQGFSAFVNPFLQQVNLQNAVLAGVLPQLFAAKMASPVVNATKAGVSALFGAQGAEQAGQAFGRASVQGIPDLGLRPGGPEMTVVGPMLKRMGLNNDGLVPTGQGTTEQWENLANEILGLVQVAGATVGPHALGREQAQPSTRGPNRYVSGEMQHGSPEMPFMMPNRPGIPMEDKPQFYETPPLIGERPLTIEQPIIRPGAVNPQDPLQIEKGIGFAGEPKQGGQISFQGQGIPSAMQSKVIPKGEQSEQAALMRGQFIPSVEKTKLQSGINPDDILPAINLGGKLLIGRQGDTHADILERNGIDPQAISHPDPARGFVNSKTGQFLSRLEAQKQSGIVGTAKAGGLDSMDLPGAPKIKVMRESGFSDSEIRGALGSKLQSGLNYDKILPGGKDDPMFPILTRIQDAGYETLYSEHGMGEGDSTPYVVFKRTSADKDARIKEAAKVVGAEVEERPKRIGVYLKESDKVEDIKKDWESFTKYLGGESKLHSGLEPIKDIFTPTARLLLRDPKRLRYEPSKTGEFDGGQLVNRLMNQVPPIEKDLLEKAGIKERFKPGSKVKAEEVDQWVKDNSPKTEVHEYGMEPNVSVKRQEFDKLTHEWYDNLDQGSRTAVNKARSKLSEDDYNGMQKELEVLGGDNYVKAGKWLDLARQVETEPLDSGPRATTVYKYVSPFDTTKYPVKRVDVVLPEARKGSIKWTEKNEKSQGDYPLWPPDSIHEQLPNTLGWAMIQYKDVGGVKTAVIGEVQSRWGQVRRESIKEMVRRGATVEEAESRTRETTPYAGVIPPEDHPLLRDYNRLILKAAIDQARKDGAKRIVLSDAETAMMTEGHDITTRHADGRPAAGEFDLPQAKGMRLNYDKILPQIMEELTGSKGEKVGLGEHKNAFNEEPGSRVWEPRENLIFRNPDSTPKTSVTGLSYDISEVGQPPYSMFGKKLYSGLGLEPLQDLGEKLKNDLSTIGNLFRRGRITDMVAAKRDAVDNLKLRAQNIAENHVKLEATKLFNKDAEKARDAVFINLEAQKVGGLQAALTRAQGNSKVESSIRFAMDPNNTQRLQQLTDKVQRLDAQNVALADSEGITVESLDDFMKKMYEKDKSGFFFKGQRAAGQHSTIFDAIKGGAKPKSLDIVALVGQRTQEIYSKVELKRWLDHFKTVLDPKTQEPVIKPFRRNLSVPAGYTKVESLNVAIKDGYDRIFHAVTGESHINKNLVGQAMLQAEGAIKHGTLAFDIFHLSRIAQFGQSLKLGVGYKKGLSLLEYSAQDLQEAVNQGLAPEDAVNYQNETVTVPQGSWTRRQVGQILIQNGLNVGRHSEALYTAFVRSMPGLKQTVGAFNRFTFDKFSRGVLYELGQREFERVAKDYPNLSPQEVARKVSKDLNFRVGNIGRQGVIKSATMQDLTQLAFLAPRWVESMAQSEVRSIGQVASSFSNKGKLGTLGKSSVNLLATYIIATQAANYLFNDHSTFQNPGNEGHELDLFVPPLTKGGKGFYVSPLSVVAELQHDLLRYTRNSNKTPTGAIVEAGSRIIGNKLSPPLQGLMELKTGRNWKGEPLEGWDRVKDALVTSINPTPLLARQALKSSESDDLAPLERQLFATAGIKAEPESFIESRQRMSSGKSLSLGERVKQEQEIAKERPKQTDSEKIASRERAVAGEIYRGEQLKSQMTKADRQWIESRGLNLTGFDNKLHIGKTLVYLTKPEMERLSKYTLEAYNEAMPEVRQKYPQLGDNSRDVYFNARMSAARGKARTRLIQELNSLNESNQKTKKRFTVFDNE